MITAEEARELTGLSSLQAVLERIESQIKKDAALGEEETVYRYAKEEGLDMYPDKASLYEAGDGRYCCALYEGGAGVEENFYGSTPLEAINNARRGM